MRQAIHTKEIYSIPDELQTGLSHKQRHLDRLDTDFTPFVLEIRRKSKIRLSRSFPAKRTTKRPDARDARREQKEFYRGRVSTRVHGSSTRRYAHLKKPTPCPPRSNRYCIRALIVALAGGVMTAAVTALKNESIRASAFECANARTEHLRGSSARLKCLYTSAGDPSDPKNANISRGRALVRRKY